VPKSKLAASGLDRGLGIVGMMFELTPQSAVRFPLALLLALAPLGASAQTILPYTAAYDYCTLRSLGSDQKSAITAAVSKAYVDDAPVTVTVDGRSVDANFLRFMQAISTRCPQFVK